MSQATKNYTSELFTQQDPTGFSSPGGLAKYLVPAGTGSVDVVFNYPWTLTPLAGRTETPWAELTEFRILQSSFLNSARYYAQGLIQQTGATDSIYLDRMNGYAGLCDFTNPTGFHYLFPYFSETSNEVESSWTGLDFLEKIKGAADAVGAGGAVDLVSKVFKFKQELTYPRVGVADRPKLWESSTPRSININFPLFNTLENIDIKKNWDLCYLLLYQNMFNKRDFITSIPPVFYTVHIPGQFFSIAMYVSNLKIYNRGNIRGMNLDGKRINVPDVYEIDMTLTDMIMPSQNMLAELLQEKPVQVFTKNAAGEVFDSLSPEGKAFKEKVQGFLDVFKTEE